MSLATRVAEFGSSPSPLFAVRARELFEQEKYQEAIALCILGSRKHPDYSTGHLVAALCFLKLGRLDQAAKSATEGLRRSPSSKALLAVMSEIQGAPPNTQPIEERIGFNPAPTPPAKVLPNAPIEIPGLEHLGEAAAAVEGTEIDRLIEQLEGAKMPPIEPSAELPPAPEPDVPAPALASETLARIYVDQAAWVPAAEAYEALAVQIPARSDEFLARAAECRAKLR
jgi:tetratricopeptide (TPR) repeat protein